MRYTVCMECGASIRSNAPIVQFIRFLWAHRKHTSEKGRSPTNSRK